MGCVLCNITSTREFLGEKKAIRNPFYCEPGRRDEFLDNLAYDIVAYHPEFRILINKYVRKGVGKEGNKNRKGEPIDKPAALS